MSLLLQYTLVFSSVLLLVALGGCFSEHSGIINIGLEGIMVIGAMGGALVMKYMDSGLPAALLLLAVVAGSVAFGMLYSMLLGVAAIRFKADQTLVGTAMNLLGTAAATVIFMTINRAETGKASSDVYYIDIRKKFLLAEGSEYSWFMIITVVILVISWVVLYKTKFGLRLRSCGEHPQASDSVGINVYKMRYAGVLISGALGGLGGLVYITAGVSNWKFENGVAGFGFLALAVMIFGAWKPTRIALAALLFGFFRALSRVYSGVFGPLADSLDSDFFRFLNNVPGTIYNMLPYIISLIVLAFTSKSSAAPKAEGIPYDKGMR